MSSKLGTDIPSDSNFIKTQLEYEGVEGRDANGGGEELSEELTPALKLKRDISDEEEKLDKLLELIVSTRRGSFAADPDFGFEFWNHEYNIYYYGNLKDANINKQQKECSRSIENSLQVYAPQLKNVQVNVSLKSEEQKKAEGKVPKHYISITIESERNDGIRDDAPYNRTIIILINPTITAKKDSTAPKLIHIYSKQT